MINSDPFEVLCSLSAVIVFYYPLLASIFFFEFRSLHQCECLSMCDLLELWGVAFLMTNLHTTPIAGPRAGRDQQSVLRVGVIARRICDLKLLGKVTFWAAAALVRLGPGLAEGGS